MEMMMAVRAHKRGGPEVLRYEEAPRLVAGNGQVLVEVHAAAVTPGELFWDASWLREDGTDRAPMMPSHEFTGVTRASARPCPPRRFSPPEPLGVLSTCLHGKAGAGERRESAQIGSISVPRSSLSDVLPGDMCVNADLSVSGGGQSVSARTEVVGDSAERVQEALGVLG